MPSSGGASSSLGSWMLPPHKVVTVVRTSLFLLFVSHFTGTLISVQSLFHKYAHRNFPPHPPRDFLLSFGCCSLSFFSVNLSSFRAPYQFSLWPLFCQDTGVAEVLSPLRQFLILPFLFFLLKVFGILSFRRGQINSTLTNLSTSAGPLPIRELHLRSGPMNTFNLPMPLKLSTPLSSISRQRELFLKFFPQSSLFFPVIRNVVPLLTTWSSTRR